MILSSTAHTLSVLGDRPCPIVSDEVLLRLAPTRWKRGSAGRGGFRLRPSFLRAIGCALRPCYIGWPGEQPAGGPSRDGADSQSDAARLVVTGAGGGCWTIRGRADGELPATKATPPPLRKSA